MEKPTPKFTVGQHVRVMPQEPGKSWQNGLVDQVKETTNSFSTCFEYEVTVGGKTYSNVPEAHIGPVFIVSSTL